MYRIALLSGGFLSLALLAGLGCGRSNSKVEVVENAPTNPNPGNQPPVPFTPPNEAELERKRKEEFEKLMEEAKRSSALNE